MFCRSFFDWYNQDHHHAGLGLMTPDQVHTARQMRSMQRARKPSIRPFALTLTDSFTNRHNHRQNQPPPG
ncbi:MAG: integrase [Rhodospirillales bacterium]|nr:integrase [Rhodospirillales bacterium]